MNYRISHELRCFLFLSILWIVPAFPALSQNSLQSPVSQPSPLYPYLTPLARYGDMEIPLGYFLKYEAFRLKNLNKLNLDQKKLVIQDALQQMIYEHLICDLAFQEHIDQDPDYISFNRDMENERLTSLYEFKNFQLPFQVTREEVEKKYAALKETEFKLPPEFTFRQVFTQTIDKTDAQKQLARERIEAAQAALRAGSDFVQVAGSYSEAQKKDALLGPFIPSAYSSEKKINAALEEAILKMRVGDISPIVESHYGYHILKLESLTTLSYASLAEAFPTVVARLRTEKLDAWRREMKESHWKEAVALYQPEKMFDPAVPGNTPLAVVYGATTTLDQFRTLMGFSFMKNKKQSDQEYREQLLGNFDRNIVYRTIVAKLARDQRYTEIPAWIYAVKERRTRRMFTLWWDKTSEQYKRDHPVSLEEKKAYYEKHPRHVMEPLQVHAAEMTFKITPSAPADRYARRKAEQQAREKAQEALQRILAGESFAEVAMEVSESDSAAQGGDIGMVMNNDPKLPYPVVDQLLKLESGVVYPQVIETDNAFYVAKCLEKPERTPMDFADPRTQQRIETLITNQRIAELKKSNFQKLLQPEKISIVWDKIYEIDPNQVDGVSLRVP